MKFIILALLAVFISPVAQADPPHLEDRQTGKYLGNLSRIPTIQIRSTIPTGGMGVHTARIPSTIPMGNTAAATATTVPTILMPPMRRGYMAVIMRGTAIDDGNCYSE